MRSLIIALALGIFWSANASAQRPIIRNGLRTDVLGCYRLYAGEKRVGSFLFNASPSIRLDSVVIARSDKGPGVARAMIPMTEANEPMTPVQIRRARPTWAADSLTDTLRLSFINGFSGAVFILSAPRGRPDTLAGRMFEAWDFGPGETTHGPARAIRQSCGRQ